MESTPPNVRCVRTVILCSIILVALGVLGLYADLSQHLLLSSFGKKYTGMSRLIAVVFLVTAVCLHVTQKPWRIPRLCASILGLIGLLIGVYGLLPVFVAAPARLGLIDIGPIHLDLRVLLKTSRISAAGMALCSLSIVLLLQKRSKLKAIVPYLATLVLAEIFVVLLGYLYGTPVLYGGKKNSILGPVAITTAIGLAAWSVGLIAAAGTQHYPLRALTGRSASAQLLRAFLPVTVVIVVADHLLAQVLVHSNYNYSTWNAAVRDAFHTFISVTLVTMVVYLVSRRIGRRQEIAEEALRQANEELESRVRARTRELEVANIGLRESEERFRQLAENIREVLWMTDGEKKQMLYVSPGYETIWGRSCKSLYESPSEWMDAVHPQDRERIAGAVPKQESGGYNEVYRIQRPDGTMRWIRDRAFPVKDQDGKFYRLVGLAEDITEDKELEDRLALLAHAVESSAEPITITNENNEFTFVNRAFEQTTGYSRDEIMGKNALILYAPRNRAGLDDEILEQTRKGGWSGEVWDLRKDGTEFPIFLSTSQVRNSSGEMIGLMGIGRDMTERYRAESVLRESEERFRSLFESSPIGIALHDVEGRYLQVNSAYEQITGYKEEELREFGSAAAITHADDVIGEREMFEALVQGHVESYRNEIRFARKDRNVISTMLTTSLLRGGDGKIRYVISMIENITEQKNLERQMLEIAAMERQRIGHELHDGLGQFLAGIAFKIKALEVACNSNDSDGLTERMEELKSIGTLMREALSQTRRLAHGLQPIELEGGSVISALGSLAEMSENMFDVDCDFICNQPKLPLRPEAALAFYRIAQEAVHNAVNHGSAKRIRIELSVADDHVHFSIADDGTGFERPPAPAPSTHDHLMTGGGMGLRIMEYRAKAAGGQFDITSNKPRGTNIVCVFPRASVLPEHWRD